MVLISVARKKAFNHVKLASQQMTQKMLLCVKKTNEALLKSSYWRDMFNDQGNPLFESRAVPNITNGKFATHNYL